MSELKCPQGHPAQLHANVGAGKGRVRCTVCNWNDSITIGATPDDGQDVAAHGVRTFGGASSGVRRLGTPANGVEILRGR